MIVPLTPPEIDRLARGLSPRWQVIDYAYLTWEQSFPNFATALAAVNAIGAVADACDHHPDIVCKWGYVQLTLQTHTIAGLSKLDFHLAQKIDALEKL